MPVIQEKKEKRARVGAFVILSLNATQSLPLFLCTTSYIQLPVKGGGGLLHHLNDGYTKESQRNIPNHSRKQRNFYLCHFHGGEQFYDLPTSECSKYICSYKGILYKYDQYSSMLLQLHHLLKATHLRILQLFKNIIYPCTYLCTYTWT